MDVGCGTGYGVNTMADACKKIIAVDNGEASFPGILKKCHSDPNRAMCILTFCRDGAALLTSKLIALYQDIYDVHEKVDVCLAIEIFEHMPDPHRFIDHLSTLCDNLFITTPLANVTGKTDNPSHIAEYSREDFQRIVSTKFAIIQSVYQLSNMDIVPNAEYDGSSMNPKHTVQMLWCKRRQ